MPDFLNDTIFTKYALNRINDVLSGKIKETSFNRLIITENSVELSENGEVTVGKFYELSISEVYSEGDSLIVVSDIPNDLTGINIRGILLYEGDNLFTISSINTIKPSDIGYSLIIDLNIVMQNVNFYGRPDILVNPKEYTSISSYVYLEESTTESIINLERSISQNSFELGASNVVELYKEEYKNSITEKDITDCIQYSNLVKDMGSSHGISAYYSINNRTNYNIYKCINLSDNDSYIGYNNGILESVSPLYKNDGIYFEDAGGSIVIEANFNDITSGNLISKQKGGQTYFSIISDGSNILFTVYGTNGSRIYRVLPLTISNVDLISRDNNIITMTYYVDEGTPNLSIHIDENNISDIADLTIDNFTTLSKSVELPTTNTEDEIGTSFKVGNTISKIVCFNKPLSNKEVETVVRLLKIR